MQIQSGYGSAPSGEGRRIKLFLFLRHSRQRPPSNAAFAKEIAQELVNEGVQAGILTST